MFIVKVERVIFFARAKKITKETRSASPVIVIYLGESEGGGYFDRKGIIIFLCALRVLCG